MKTLRTIIAIPFVLIGVVSCCVAAVFLIAADHIGFKVRP